MQYVIIAKDGKDEQALQRRLAARSAHINRCDEMFASRKQLFGVALLNEKGDMCGSVMVVDFETREELEQWLQDEPYITGKVWEQVEVVPCKVGPTFSRNSEGIRL